MTKRVLCLFDVDGTLTEPRKEVEQSMLDEMKRLRQVGCRIAASRASVASTPSCPLLCCSLERLFSRPIPNPAAGDHRDCRWL